MTREIYLGDGVYAKWQGGTVTLDLRAQGPDKIVLEPQVLDALAEFRELCEREQSREDAGGGS